MSDKEEIYGKLIKEDENYSYYTGHGGYGVCIPKKANFVIIDNLININLTAQEPAAEADS